VDRLDGTDDERPIRARPAEERHIVARPGHDVVSAHELAGAGGSDAGLERTGGQRDDLALACSESPARRVDLEDAAPQACRSRRILWPAFLPAPERASPERAARQAKKQDTDRGSEDAPRD
jgi:hypothetical protein